MDLFAKAKTVRLRSYLDRYLVAEEDSETVSQGRDGSENNAIWTVEVVLGQDYIRLKSCYGTYLTASSLPFLPGFTGRQVVQSAPQKCDPATQWEPLRDGMQVRLRSLWGNFLRPNGGLPPWRNSVTHDVPHRSSTYDKILWDVEVVETLPRRLVHRKTHSQSSESAKFVRTRLSDHGSLLMEHASKKVVHVLYQVVDKFRSSGGTKREEMNRNLSTKYHQLDCWDHGSSID